MNDPRNPSKQICRIVDSLSFYENVESIIGRKIEIKGANNIIKYLLDNGYIYKLQITNFSMSNENIRIFDNTNTINFLNQLMKKNEIEVVVDEKIFDNIVANINNNFKKVNNLLKQYGYCIIFFSSIYQTYFGIIKLEDIENKKYHNNVFEESGFAEYRDINRKVQILYKNNKKIYEYKTNTIYEVPNSNFKFIICTEDNKYLQLLINQYVEIIEGEMSRTAYPGLWNEPKQFVCAFSENNIFKVETNENEILEISVI